MMKLSSSVWFLSLIFSSEKCNSSELRTEDYVQLISDLHEHFQPSSVILIYFADIDRSTGTNLIFELTLMLARRRILTMSVPLKKTHLSENGPVSSRIKVSEYQKIKQISRSMSVILFTSQEEIEELKRTPGDIEVYVSINFVLFAAKDAFFEESCIEFLHNKLQFSLEATILIKCYSDEAIRRWYPFKNNGTEFTTWAHWRPKTRLILKTKISNHRKIGNLSGTVLRIATVESSYLTKWEDGKLIGYLGEVLQLLEEIMNFTVSHVKEEKEFGSWNDSTQTWSGAMGLVVRGEVDLVLAGLLLTRERLLSVDFSIPLFSTRGTLYIKKPSNGKAINWTGYFEPFSHKIWLSILLVILTVPLLLTLMKKKLKNLCSLSNSISECYLNVLGIYCQQGLREFPTIASLRVAYFSIFVCSFIVMALYSASLVSYLAVPLSNMPFSNLEGFVKDGSYALIVSRDGSEFDGIRKSNESILKRMNKLMLEKDDLPLTEDDAFDMVCNNKIAFYDSEISNERNNINISCQIVRITSRQFDTVGMVLRKDSPYRRMIDYHLNQLRYSGILSRLKLKNLKQTVKLGADDFDKVGILGIAILLVILAGGIILGMIILFFERMYFNHRLESMQIIPYYYQC